MSNCSLDSLSSAERSELIQLVRELERRRSALSTRPPARSSPPRDPDLARLEERLRERLTAPVRLRYDATRARGRIEIGFTSLEECDGILERLGIRQDGV